MKPLTFSILRLLCDGEFYSETTIAQNLNVSSTDVSGTLSELDKIGLAVLREHDGYRLLDPVQWLKKDMILKHLGVEAKNFHLEVFDTIKSTNTFLLQKTVLEKDLNNISTNTISVVAAEFQTNGYGRHGQKWHSGLGDCLTFSLMWRFQKGAHFLSGLSLAAGIAIIRTLESLGIKDIVLKWPNDVMSNYQKLAGTLIELRGNMLGPTFAVIGIGLNFKLSNKIKSYIDQNATDLFSVSGKTLDRNKLMAGLLINLVAVLKKFEDQGFKPFRNEWIYHHGFENKLVTLHLPNGSVQNGVVQGAMNDGSLPLKTTEGIRCFSEGTIKLYKAK